MRPHPLLLESPMTSPSLVGKVASFFPLAGKSSFLFCWIIVVSRTPTFCKTVGHFVGLIRTHPTIFVKCLGYVSADISSADRCTLWRHIGLQGVNWGALTIDLSCIHIGLYRGTRTDHECPCRVAVEWLWCEICNFATKFVNKYGFSGLLPS